MSNSNPIVLFVVTEDGYHWSHRVVFTVGVHTAGYTVCDVTRGSDHGERIKSVGPGFVPLDLDLFAPEGAGGDKLLSGHFWGALMLQAWIENLSSCSEHSRQTYVD